MGAHDQMQDRRRDARLQNHPKYCCFCIPGFKIVVILSFFAYQASKPEQILWFLRVRFQNHCKYCCFCVPGFKMHINLGSGCVSGGMGLQGLTYATNLSIDTAALTSILFACLQEG